jgi:beta-glucanase (GH16 family)
MSKMPIKLLGLASALFALSVAVGLVPSASDAKVPVGYDLVWSDNFKAPKLDASKWWTRYIYSGGLLDFLNDEQQRFREAGNHVMGSDGLSLVAQYHPENDPKSGWAIYTSGMIRSKRTFLGGYFQTRMRLPRQYEDPPGSGTMRDPIGIWPGFWLNSAADAEGVLDWPPEIDIIEMVNNGVSEFSNMMHLNSTTNDLTRTSNNLYAHPDYNNEWGWMGQPWKLTDWTKGPNGDGFHVYALLWEILNETTGESKLSYYIDDELILVQHYFWRRREKTVAAPYASVLFDLAIGGHWANGGDITSIHPAMFPVAVEIASVEVYQKTGQTRMKVEAIGQDLLR